MDTCPIKPSYSWMDWKPHPLCQMNCQMCIWVKILGHKSYFLDYNCWNDVRKVFFFITLTELVVLKMGFVSTKRCLTMWMLNPLYLFCHRSSSHLNLPSSFTQTYWQPDKRQPRQILSWQRPSLQYGLDESPTLDSVTA